MSSRKSARFFGAILLFILAGCGKEETFATAPVSGKVTLNGVPLANATVVFQPSASGKPGPSSSGETDEEGEFTLTCSDGKDGAVVGPHKVFITTRQMKPSAANSDIQEEVAPEQVPENYKKDPLKFEVKVDGTDAANFSLTGTAGAQGAQPSKVRND